MINTDLFTDITLSSAAVVPVIVALVQVVKLTQWLKDKYAPILSIVFGIILAFLLVQDGLASIGTTILTGILYGLASSGLYSGVRSTSHAIKMDRMRTHKDDPQKRNK